MCVCLVFSFDPSVRLYFCLILFPVLILVLDALDFLDFFRADFGTGKPVPRKLRRRCCVLLMFDFVYREGRIILIFQIQSKPFVMMIDGVWLSTNNLII